MEYPWFYFLLFLLDTFKLLYSVLPETVVVCETVFITCILQLRISKYNLGVNHVKGVQLNILFSCV